MEKNSVKLEDFSNLLGPEDPPAVEHINHDGTAHLVLVCDHAGQNVPASLNGLDMSAESMRRHIAYDIGAAAVTRHLSKHLDATAILQSYSRLVIDCNRPVGHPESIPEVSDNTFIPTNSNISEEQVNKRIDSLFWPYHQAISNTIGQRWRAHGRPPILFSVHSFTPYFEGTIRPWDAGILYNRDHRLAMPMLDILREDGLNIGNNQPYSGLKSGYTIDLHGTSSGLANLAIEIRQDQITDAAGQEHWAKTVAKCLIRLLKRPEFYSVLKASG